MHGMSQTDSETAPYEYRVGDPLPAAMGPGELMRALNMRRSQFHDFQRQGKFKRFEFARPIGIKRYSGKKVSTYLEGAK